MTILGILENIVSNFLFVLLGLLIGWAILKVLRRDKLLYFFGVASSRRIVIYISNLRVQSFGAIGIDNVNRSYQGSTAAFYELQSAIKLRDLFNYLLPSLSEKPGLLAKLLISDILVQVLHSPLQKSQLDNSSPFIAMGSPAFNVASKYIEEELQSQVKFRLGTIAPWKSLMTPYGLGPTAHSTQTPIYPTGSSYTPSASPAGAVEPGAEEIPPAFLISGLAPITDTSYGFVERLIDTRHANRHIFYVAGLSEIATAGAAQFLVTEWQRLSNKNGKQAPFLVMLRFEPTDLTKWNIIFER